MRKNLVINLNDLNQAMELIKGRETKKKLLNSMDIHFNCVNDELVLDCFYGTEVYPIRETALATILERMGVNGKTFRVMSDKELADVFKILNHYLPEFVTVMISDGAVNSINSVKYVHIPMEEILDETLSAVAPMCKGDVKIDGIIGYDKTVIDFFTDRNFVFNKKNNRLIVRLTNSENGTSSVRYSVYAYTNRSTQLLPIMNDVRVEHKGNDASMDKVVESVSMLEAVINNAVTRLKRLQNITITNIETVIQRIGSKIGFPKTYIKQVSEDFADIDECKASDIYEAYVQNVLGNFDKNSSSFEKYENDLLKMVALDWDELQK